jgi:PAS domain S-box-containing protein
MSGSPRSIHVLYVDDQSNTSRLAADTLPETDDRFRVRTAATVAEARSILSEADIDCIVSAFGNPALDGISFLESVREEHPDLPFILFTERGDEGVASEAISAGVTDYIRKDGQQQFTLLGDRILTAVSDERSDADYHEILEKTADGIILHDPDTGEVVFANQRFCEIIGYDPEEVRGMTVGEFTADLPDFTEERARRLLRDAATKGPQVFEWYTEHADGSVVPVEVRLDRTRLRGGDLVVASVRDITERKGTQRRLEGVIENAEQAIYVKSTDGTYDLVNPAAADALGASREEILGKTDAALMNEEDADRIMSVDRRVIEEGEPVTYERRLPTGESEQYYRNQKFPLRDVTGDVTGIVGISSDITERRRREQRLQVQRDRFQALHKVATDIETCESPDAVYERIVDAAEEVLDFDMAIIDAVEDAALVPVAVSSELTADRYYQETPLDAEDNEAAAAFRSGESSVIEDIQASGASPASATFRSALTVPIGEHGVFQTVDSEPGAFDETDRELVELLVAHAETRLTRLINRRELTERTRELERQNERLEEFASVVSHDLRNPLNVVRGRLELASEQTDETHLEDAAAALDRMESLVDDLLTLARQGPEIGELQAVDLGDSVTDCWTTVETSEATLDLQVDGEIRAIPGRLKQLLENLIGNAIEHAGPDVTVTVGTMATGFYVEDDGPGIPAERQADIFEPGYSTGSQVTGLGLNIVTEVADAHGWTITVTDSPDGGARFEFTGVEFV